MAATPKPKQEIKTTMANKIARGTTGQADFLQIGKNITAIDCDAYVEDDVKWIIELIGGSQYATNIDNPQNWGGQNTGNSISVPFNVEAGGYSYINNWRLIPSQTPGSSLCDYVYDEYEFEVVCMTAKLDLTKNTLNAVYTATATPDGGTAPFTYAWTLPPQAYEASGLGTDTVTFKWDGNESGAMSVTITDADTPNPCMATATADAANPCTLQASITGSSGSRNLPRPDGGSWQDIGASVNIQKGVTPYAIQWDGPDAESVNTLKGDAAWDGRTSYGYPFVNTGASWRVPLEPEDRQIPIKATITDSNTPPCVVVLETIVSTHDYIVDPPIDCPAGQHDDGTGNCVPDPTDPTEPKSCAAGYYYDEAQQACVVEPPPPPTGSCTLDCSFKVDDKGANLYRVEAVPTGAQGAVSASWRRDGVALASLVLFVEETIAPNAESVFQCTLTDSACSITRSVVVRNDDGATGPVTPVDPTLAAPAAPTVARDCEAGALIVTPPAFPTNATSLELQRDDGTAILYTFANAGAWNDENTLETVEYRYRLRSVNAEGGRSEWGAWSAAKSRVSDALTIAWLSPIADAVLSRDVILRFQLTDTGETLNECNLPQLPENACAGLDVNDAQITIALGGFALDIAAQLKEGTPRNGIYEAIFDARDYSDGARPLIVKARGSDCCFAAASRVVSVLNTLVAGGFYQEIRSQARQGEVAPRARFGIETRALNANPSRNYWMEVGARSGTTLDGDYSDEAWKAHQPVVLGAGEAHEAQGNRFERQNWGATIRFILPLSRQIRARQKWRPQFAMACLDAGAPVAKIRQIEAGKHMVWTTGDARALIYDGTALTPIFEGANHAAGTALDAALSGDKLYVANAGGELFAFDTDAGDVAMNYSVRGETRAPRFVERVGDLAIALYVGDGTTRAYNMAFGAPRLLWELDKEVTLTAVSGGRLLMGAGTTLYASVDGLAAPLLIHNFAVTLTSLGEKFVGFGNGDVRVKNGESWDLTVSRAGAVNGVVEWRGGMAGEVPDVSASATLGGVGAWLSSQKAGGTWFDERELLTPLDLLPREVGDVSAMELYRTEKTLAVGDVSETTADERLLVGTSTGLLFVYGRSLLRPAPGVIAVSRDAAVRLWGFGQVPPPTNTTTPG